MKKFLIVLLGLVLVCGIDNYVTEIVGGRIIADDPGKAYELFFAVKIDTITR